MWQLNCQHVYAQAAGDVIGSTAPHVNVERIKNYRIVLPPHHEQMKIAQFISAQIEVIDHSITNTRRQIDLLREYRTRLIADVVTGKLDVRSVELPSMVEDEITKDLESIDEPEPDEIDDLEETADDDD
jgi:hypothetical protein